MQIHIQDLTVVLNHHTILNTITCHIPSGSKVGLLGPNGSGKSTLLKTLAGLIPPITGEIRYNDVLIEHLKQPQRSKNIAMVSQHSQLDDDVIVEDIIRLGRTPHRGILTPWRSHDKQAVDSALHQTDLLPLRARPWGSLSGGQQQRVHMARALAQEPTLLLLDEPTNHLDIQYQLELMALIHDLEQTCLISMHDLNLALNYCDLVLILAQGTLTNLGPPSLVINAQSIYDTYGVNSTILQDETQTQCISFHRAATTAQDGAFYQPQSKAKLTF